MASKENNQRRVAEMEEARKRARGLFVEPTPDPVEPEETEEE